MKSTKDLKGSSIVVLSQHSPGETEENQENYQGNRQATEIQSGYLNIRDQCVADPPTCWVMSDVNGTWTRDPRL
jgi:hypothetical protein